MRPGRRRASCTVGVRRARRRFARARIPRAIVRALTRFFDLSHPIVDGMRTYPGLPAPSISIHLSREGSRALYAAGTEFHIGRIDMVANTGTYLDAPFHRYAEGADVSELPLPAVADLPGVVMPTGERAIGAEAFAGLALAGRAVLIRTGWSERWGTEAYFAGHPHLTKTAAEFLADAGAALVGIDSLNIDSTADGSRPAHSILLSRGIPIVEHLTDLDRLPGSGFRFFAVPAGVRGMGTFPVRAFAIV
jgi:kynurenine formamidase